MLISVFTHDKLFSDNLGPFCSKDRSEILGNILCSNLTQGDWVSFDMVRSYIDRGGFIPSEITDEYDEKDLKQLWVI